MSLTRCLVFVLHVLCFTYFCQQIGGMPRRVKAQNHILYNYRGSRFLFLIFFKPLPRPNLPGPQNLIYSIFFI